LGTEAFIDKELTVSLSGNLGFVSLDEVLRLLTRSGQRGAVAVTGDGISGRVFVTRGGINLATTTDDEGLRTLLTKSGLLDVDQLDSASPLVGREDNELIDLLREVSVESLYRLGLKGDSFEVYEDQESRYASPKPFELENLLEDARKRLDDWAEVNEVVPNLSTQVSFQRDLGEREEVTIRRDAWRVLTEVGSGASVTRIAEELGTTEFWTARVVARLIEDDLIETASEPVPAAEPQPEAPSWDSGVFEEPAEAHEEPAPAYGEPAADSGQEEGPGPAFEEAPPAEPVSVGEAGELAEAPAAEGADEDVDPNQSWWEEPEAEEAGEEVEQDTEAFLEKVFSELESPEGEEEEEEGYGLLRRRRLGAIRDFGNDS
jgi:hypothetical protein